MQPTWTLLQAQVGANRPQGTKGSGLTLDEPNPTESAKIGRSYEERALAAELGLVLPSPAASRRVAITPTGRPSRLAAIGDLAEAAVVVGSGVDLAQLQRMFRADPELPAIVFDRGDGPVAVERSWFAAMLTERRGPARRTDRRRPLRDLRIPSGLRLDFDTPLDAALSALVAHAETSGPFDVVLLDGPGRIRIVRAGELLRRFSCTAAAAGQAGRDPLTGLPTRAQLTRRLQALRPEHGEVVLLQIDIDQFTEVNHTFGYPVGDQVLVLFARRLAALSRAGDRVFRLGADEFAILVESDLGRAVAAAMAERVVAQAAAPFSVTAHLTDSALTELDLTLSITARVGVAFWSADEAHPAVGTADIRLLREADLAVRRAKAAGTGRVVFFDAEPPARVRDESERGTAQLEARLQAAISGGRLRLHYQPIVDLGSGLTTGVEALARWVDPVLGPVSPEKFITLAERTGLIFELGRWALRTACRDAASWVATAGGHGRSDSTIAVNVSPVQLADPSFVADVTAALADSGLSPQRLCLEITETAAIVGLAQTSAVLKQLSDLGIRLALDDFGTGYSSLTMLRRLPVHVIKIDRSFINDVATNASDAVLIRLVIDAAHSLGLRVCAEGIETADQAGQVAAMGADSAQGWYLGVPAPTSSALEQRLTESQADGALGFLRQPLKLGANYELILLTTPDRVIRYASSASIPMMGYRPGEVIGTHITDYLHPDDLEPGTDGGLLPGLAADGSAVHRARHRDGSYRWLSSTSQFVRDEAGEVREVLSISHDITSTITAQRALTDTEAMFRHAFDDALIGMALSTVEGRLLRVNHAFADLLGRSPEELLNLTVADITQPADRAADDANTEALLAGSVSQVDLRKHYLHADGRPLAVQVRAILIAPPGGADAYLLAHVHLRPAPR
jgi:diguanylate cyclase (GGDEF)-like protein/PAS domain S-box-containing protein